MQSPIANRSVRLLEIDGTLGISHIDYATTMAELWVLRDYKIVVSVIKVPDCIVCGGDEGTFSAWGPCFKRKGCV